ncbi:HNH endonuclease [Halobacterium wangiae]|uniref:HNH endonuclease n=1 Tax=Halobacterium wangiae TaxID=2902623 RepID=UPI001E30DB35|nr:HNH endonuclease [Halobacterium wangiae]
MSRWRRVVRRELARYREEAGTDVLERQEFLAFALPVFREEFPDANTPGQTFSREMQQLRDAEEVEFLGNGTYRLVALDTEHGDTTDAVDAAREWPYEASEYETTVGARSLPAAFREAVLARYDSQCPVSGVDHPRLLDVAHVLSWSDHESLRTDPGNVVALDRTHHAAFDAGLYTLDGDFRLHVSPAFETESALLRRTLLDRDGERVDVPEGALDPANLRRRNQSLDWW